MLRAFQSASSLRTAAKNMVQRRSHLPEKVKNAALTLVRPLFSFFAMFFLMRAEAFNSISPLAPAFLSAALSSGRHPAMLCAGCMAGMIRLPLHTSALVPAIACALTLMGELALSFVRMRRISPETRCAVLGGVGVMLPALFFACGEVFASLQAIAASAIAASAAPFFLASLNTGKNRRKLMLQEKTGVMLLVAAFTGGVYALSPAAAYGVSIFCALMLHPAGTVSGVICGLGCMLGGAELTFVAPLAVCAFAAGWKICRNRLHRSLCAAAATALMCLGAAIPPVSAACGLIAAAVYALLPRKLSDAASILHVRPEAVDPDRMAREICEESRSRLTAMAEAFAEMAESCAVTEALPDEQALISEMRSRLCSGCAGYPSCWNGSDNHAVHFLCALIGEALERADAPVGQRVIYSDGEIPPEIMRFCRRGRMIPDRLGLLLRDFAEKRRSVVKRSMNNRSLGVQYAQARELLFALADRQGAPLKLQGEQLQRLEAALERAEITGCEASASRIGGLLEICVSRTGSEWSREEAIKASQAFAQAFGGGFTPRKRGNALCFSQKPRYEIQTGVSCRAGIAGEICGDSHLLRMLNPSRLAVMLSDGMGCGKKAAHESANTLKMLWRFLHAGINRTLAIETANRHMLMRTGDDIYATVDLAVIDLNTGTAEFSKLAACRSIILRGSEILSIDGGNLPLGILESVRPSVKTVKLKEGDTVIMASDGVMDACDAPSINRILRSHASAAPDVIAEEMVREAALRRDQSRSDDMTCICLRIIESKNRYKNPVRTR